MNTKTIQKNKKMIILICIAALLVIGGIIIALVTYNKPFTVKFVYPDGTEISSVEMVYGKEFVEPEVKNRNGQVFIKWDKELRDLKTSATVKAVMENVTDAKWGYSTYYDPENSKAGKSIRLLGETESTTIVFPISGGGEKILAIHGSALEPISSTVEKVIIPFGIVEITDNAFMGCRKLKEIVISSSVKIIASNAFQGCPISNITFPNSLKSIAGNAFGERSTAIKITINKYNKFFKVFENNIISLDGRTFNCYADFTNKKVDIKAPINTIAKDAFNMQNINEVYLPETLRVISDGAFENCNYLTYVRVNNRLETIGNDAFSGCMSLSEFLFPSSLTSIGNNCFRGAKLKSVFLPKKLTKLGDNVFQGNMNISIYTQASKNSIQKKQSEWANEFPVFYDYNGSGEGIKYTVKFVGHLNDVEVDITSYKVEFGKPCKVINIPSDDIIIEGNAYEIESWSAFKDSQVEIDDYLKTITSDITIYGRLIEKNSVFTFSLMGYEGVSGYGVAKGKQAADATYLEIPAMHKGIPVVIIQSEGFQGLTNLEKIDFPDTIEHINKRAFSGCSKLEMVKLPFNLKILGDEAFYGCDSLKSIAFPDSLRTIRYKSFADCSGLQTISLNKVETIEAAAFQNCKALTAIDIPSTLKTVGARAFDCLESKIREVIIPITVELVGEYAFNLSSNCTLKCDEFTQEDIVKLKWHHFWHGLSKVVYKKNIM
ncbi:MAG: leucine-rich repeat domain-containing protein [Clostridia bacterium]